MDKIAASIARIAAEAVLKAEAEAKPVSVQLPPYLSAAVDAWISAQPEPKPTRPEAVRYALTNWLTGRGYVRHREDPEGAN